MCSRPWGGGGGLSVLNSTHATLLMRTVCMQIATPLTGGLIDKGNVTAYHARCSYSIQWRVVLCLVGCATVDATRCKACCAYRRSTLAAHVSCPCSASVAKCGLLSSVGHVGMWRTRYEQQLSTKTN